MQRDPLYVVATLALIASYPGGAQRDGRTGAQARRGGGGKTAQSGLSLSWTFDTECTNYVCIIKSN